MRYTNALKGAEKIFPPLMLFSCCNRRNCNRNRCCRYCYNRRSCSRNRLSFDFRRQSSSYIRSSPNRANCRNRRKGRSCNRRNYSHSRCCRSNYSHSRLSC